LCPHQKEKDEKKWYCDNVESEDEDGPLTEDEDGAVTLVEKSASKSIEYY